MNIMVIVCDQLRYDATNFNGNEFVKTPNMNRLASKSTIFNNAFCQSPACAPARHSLVTGKYPAGHGVLKNSDQSMAGINTIAHILKPLGYRRFQLGNMHWRSKDLNNGFEPWVCAKLQNDTISKKAYKHALWEDLEITRRTTAGPSIRQIDEYWGFQVASNSSIQLEEAVCNNQSFLSWNCIIEPHPPFYPPREIYESIDQIKMPLPIESDNSYSIPHKSIVEKQQEWLHLTDMDKKRLKAGYFGMVELADVYVGMLLDTLDKLNLWENTIIIFTSDHGEQLGDHDLYSKFVMREGSVHIPFMIYHPDISPETCDSLIEQVDLYPTICDFLNIQETSDLDGRSLKVIMENKSEPKDWRKEVFAQLGNTKMIRNKKYKLVSYGDNGYEFFDIQKDPNELVNRISDPSYFQEFQRLLGIMSSRY